MDVLGADSPVILYNGGRVFDFAEDRVLYDRRLATEATRRSLAVIRHDRDLQPHLFLDDRVYVERGHPLTDAYLDDDGLTCEVVPSFEPLLTGDPHKILVIGTPPQVEKLDLNVRAAGIAVHTVQSETTYLEFLPPGASKGTALAAMCEVLGMRPDQAIAVGDGWNDVEMIEAAGLGVAMATAPEGVRARADHVCASADEDGVREVLERFILSHGP